MTPVHGHNVPSANAARWSNLNPIADCDLAIKANP